MILYSKIQFIRLLLLLRRRVKVLIDRTALVQFVEVADVGALVTLLENGLLWCLELPELIVISYLRLRLFKVASRHYICFRLKVLIRERTCPLLLIGIVLVKRGRLSLRMEGSSFRERVLLLLYLVVREA